MLCNLKIKGLKVSHVGVENEHFNLGNVNLELEAEPKEIIDATEVYLANLIKIGKEIKPKKNEN